MNGQSLRGRLLAVICIWSIVTLAAAGLAIVAAYAASVERDLAEDLAARLDQLTATISRPLPVPETAMSDPRYHQPAGGLYYQVEEVGTQKILRSRSLWDASLVLPAPPPGGDLLAEGRGPKGQAAALLVRDVLLGGNDGTPERRLRLAVAEDRALRSRDIGEFSLQMALALLFIALSIGLAGWLILHMGLRPVAALEGEIAAIAAGRAAGIAGQYPREFAPLVSAVNGLMELHEKSITLNRQRADDLAHGLKTPLAVLQATAERLRESGDGHNASALELLAAQMSERIDFQMRLSQLRIRSKTRLFATPLDAMLIRSVAVMRKTGRGADLFWRVDAAQLAVDVDPHDLMELVGVLLENAGRWAQSEVEVLCETADDMAHFQVSDDGPGLTPDDIARLGERGRRLDEQRSGSGLGIAIGKEIARLNGGFMTLGPSRRGGLMVRVALPLAPI